MIVDVEKNSVPTKYDLSKLNTSLVDTNALKEFSTTYGSRQAFAEVCYGYAHYCPSPWIGNISLNTKNTFEQAFNVASMLIEQGHIKALKLQDFIKLIREIADKL